VTASVAKPSAEISHPEASRSPAPSLVNAQQLRGMLADGQEIALIDVREELIFSQNHLLLARSVPLSRFEVKFAQLVPRRGTRIVLCGDGVAARAAGLLARNR
jgi:rhodanese-related sulfurtransferase